MRQWIQKLIDQFDLDWGEASKQDAVSNEVSEDRATLLYIIDTYNKHLVDLEQHPVRKVRQVLDEFSKALLKSKPQDDEKLLFRFRQFFSRYRIDEYTYTIRTFEDFRAIIWDFVDQLSDEFSNEKIEDEEIKENLGELREAVETNSIDLLKNQSRHFIDSYIEYQTRRDTRRTGRMAVLKKNLSVVKKKLVEANHNMSRDHLTSAYNRKSFDERMKEHWKLFKVSNTPITLMMLDIDFFKKINDTYGHAVGDFILIDLVKLLQKNFTRNSDFVARVGGEEFAIILPDYAIEHAVKKADDILHRIREEAFVHEDKEIRFTCSIGISQLKVGEPIDKWMKRADDALYHSKSTGRDRFSVAEEKAKPSDAA